MFWCFRFHSGVIFFFCCSRLFITREYSYELYGRAHMQFFSCLFFCLLLIPHLTYLLLLNLLFDSRFALAPSSCLLFGIDTRSIRQNLIHSFIVNAMQQEYKLYCYNE